MYHLFALDWLSNSSYRGWLHQMQIQNIAFSYILQIPSQFLFRLPSVSLCLSLCLSPTTCLNLDKVLFSLSGFSFMFHIYSSLPFLPAYKGLDNHSPYIEVWRYCYLILMTCSKLLQLLYC